MKRFHKRGGQSVPAENKADKAGEEEEKEAEQKADLTALQAALTDLEEKIAKLKEESKKDSYKTLVTETQKMVEDHEVTQEKADKQLELVKTAIKEVEEAIKQEAEQAKEEQPKEESTTPKKRGRRTESVEHPATEAKETPKVLPMYTNGAGDTGTYALAEEMRKIVTYMRKNGAEESEIASIKANYDNLNEKLGLAGEDGKLSDADFAVATANLTAARDTIEKFLTDKEGGTVTPQPEGTVVNRMERASGQNRDGSNTFENSNQFYFEDGKHGSESGYEKYTYVFFSKRKTAAQDNAVRNAPSYVYMDVTRLSNGWKWDLYVNRGNHDATGGRVWFTVPKNQAIVEDSINIGKGQDPDNGTSRGYGNDMLEALRDEPLGLTHESKGTPQSSGVIRNNKELVNRLPYSNLNDLARYAASGLYYTRDIELGSDQQLSNDKFDKIRYSNSDLYSFVLPNGHDAYHISFITKGDSNPVNLVYAVGYRGEDSGGNAIQVNQWYARADREITDSEDYKFKLIGNGFYKINLNTVNGKIGYAEGAIRTKGNVIYVARDSLLRKVGSDINGVLTYLNDGAGNNLVNYDSLDISSYGNWYKSDGVTVWSGNEGQSGARNKGETWRFYKDNGRTELNKIELTKDAISTPGVHKYTYTRTFTSDGSGDKGTFYFVTKPKKPQINTDLSTLGDGPATIKAGNGTQGFDMYLYRKGANNELIAVRSDGSDVKLDSKGKAVKEAGNEQAKATAGADGTGTFTISKLQLGEYVVKTVVKGKWFDEYDNQKEHDTVESDPSDVKKTIAAKIGVANNETGDKLDFSTKNIEYINYPQNQHIGDKSIRFLVKGATNITNIEVDSGGGYGKDGKFPTTFWKVDGKNTRQATIRAWVSDKVNNGITDNNKAGITNLKVRATLADSTVKELTTTLIVPPNKQNFADNTNATLVGQANEKPTVSTKSFGNNLSGTYNVGDKTLVWKALLVKGGRDDWDGLQPITKDYEVIAETNLNTDGTATFTAASYKKDKIGTDPLKVTLALVNTKTNQIVDNLVIPRSNHTIQATIPVAAPTVTPTTSGNQVLSTDRTLSGTGTAGATIKVTVAGQTVSNNVQVGTDGNWTVQLTRGLNSNTTPDQLAPKDPVKVTQILNGSESAETNVTVAVGEATIQPSSASQDGTSLVAGAKEVVIKAPHDAGMFYLRYTDKETGVTKDLGFKRDTLTSAWTSTDSSQADVKGTPTKDAFTDTVTITMKKAIKEGTAQAIANIKKDGYQSPAGWKTINVTNQAPTIAASQGNTKTVEKDERLDLNTLVTVSDREDNLNATLGNGVQKEIVSVNGVATDKTVNTNRPGSYLVKYKAVDSQGTSSTELNVTVNVKPTAPTVTAADNGDVTVSPATQDNVNRVRFTYTNAHPDTPTDKTVTATKTDSGWTLTGAPTDGVTIDSATGIITIKDREIKDNTPVSAKAITTDNIENSSTPATSKVGDRENPTFTFSNKYTAVVNGERVVYVTPTENLTGGSITLGTVNDNSGKLREVLLYHGDGRNTYMEFDLDYNKKTKENNVEFDAPYNIEITGKLPKLNPNTNRIWENNFPIVTRYVSATDAADNKLTNTFNAQDPNRVVIKVLTQAAKYDPTINTQALNKDVTAAGATVTDAEFNAMKQNFTFTTTKGDVKVAHNTPDMAITMKDSGAITRNTDGTYGVGATITYPDGSTEEVRIPVSKSDTVAPTATMEGATLTNDENTTANFVVFKGSTFNPNIRVSDDKSAITNLSVSGLPNGTTFEKTGTWSKNGATIQVDTPANTSTDTATLGTRVGTITVTDALNNTNTYKFKYTVVDFVTINSPKTVEKGTQIGNAASFVKVVDSDEENAQAKNSLYPSGSTTFTWKKDNVAVPNTTALNTPGQVTGYKVVITATGGAGFYTVNGVKTYMPATMERDVTFLVKPTAPTVTAENNGDVTITQLNETNVNRIQVTYMTQETTPREVMYTATKQDNGRWAFGPNVPMTIDSTTGTITLKDRFVQDRTTVKVKMLTTDATGNVESSEATGTAGNGDHDFPTVTFQNTETDSEGNRVVYITPTETTDLPVATLNDNSGKLVSANFVGYNGLPTDLTNVNINFANRVAKDSDETQHNAPITLNVTGTLSRTNPADSNRLWTDGGTIGTIYADAEDAAGNVLHGSPGTKENSPSSKTRVVLKVKTQATKYTPTVTTPQINRDIRQPNSTLTDGEFNSIKNTLTFTADKGTVNVQKDTANLTFTSNKKVNKNTDGSLYITATVSYPDGSTEDIRIPVSAPEQKEFYTPTAVEKTVDKGSSPAAQDSISNAKDLPSDTRYVWKAGTLDTSTPGVKQAKVTVTYSDNSSEEVKATVNVRPTQPTVTSANGDVTITPVDEPNVTKLVVSYTPADSNQLEDNGTVTKTPQTATTIEANKGADNQWTITSGGKDGISISIDATTGAITLKDQVVKDQTSVTAKVSAQNIESIAGTGTATDGDQTVPVIGASSKVVEAGKEINIPLDLSDTGVGIDEGNIKVTNLPTGLSYDTTTKSITGTLGTVSNNIVTVAVLDKNGNKADKSITITAVKPKAIYAIKDDAIPNVDTVSNFVEVPTGVTVTSASWKDGNKPTTATVGTTNKTVTVSLNGSSVDLTIPVTVYPKVTYRKVGSKEVKTYDEIVGQPLTSRLVSGGGGFNPVTPDYYIEFEGGTKPEGTRVEFEGGAPDDTSTTAGITTKTIVVTYPNGAGTAKKPVTFNTYGNKAKLETGKNYSAETTVGSAFEKTSAGDYVELSSTLDNPSGTAIGWGNGYSSPNPANKAQSTIGLREENVNVWYGKIVRNARGDDTNNYNDQDVKVILAVKPKAPTLTANQFQGKAGTKPEITVSNLPTSAQLTTGSTVKVQLKDSSGTVVAEKTVTDGTGSTTFTANDYKSTVALGQQLTANVVVSGTYKKTVKTDRGTEKVDTKYDVVSNNSNDVQVTPQKPTFDTATVTSTSRTLSGTLGGFDATNRVVELHLNDENNTVLSSANPGEVTINGDTWTATLPDTVKLRQSVAKNGETTKPSGITVENKVAGMAISTTSDAKEVAMGTYSVSPTIAGSKHIDITVPHDAKRVELRFHNSTETGDKPNSITLVRGADGTWHTEATRAENATVTDANGYVGTITSQVNPANKAENIVTIPLNEQNGANKLHLKEEEANGDNTATYRNGLGLRVDYQPEAGQDPTAAGNWKVVSVTNTAPVLSHQGTEGSTEANRKVYPSGTSITKEMLAELVTVTDPEDNATDANNKPYGSATIEIVSGLTETLGQATPPGNYTVTLKATDSQGRESNTLTVYVGVRKQKDENNPTAVPQTVDNGVVPNAETSITTDKPLPANTRVEWQTPPTTTTKGATSGVVVVTYPDGTTDEVTVPITVRDQNATYNPTAVPQTVDNGVVPNAETSITTDNTERKPEVVTPDEQPAETENTTTKPKASQNILPNTGMADGLGIFSAAAASILAGLGLIIPVKKEDEEEEETQNN